MIPAHLAPPPARSSPNDENWLTPRHFAALLALLIFVVFPSVLVGARTFIYRDFGEFALPVASYVRESIWRGEVPLWNPLNNCGVPFLAQWATLVCYPLSLIYLVLPLPWSLNLFCLLHMWLAGMNMYWLARHWTGHELAAAWAGVAFTFSGWLLSALIWPNYMAALAWLPAVVLWSERAWQEGRQALLAAALVGELQMLSGTPEVILLTWLMILALWLHRWWNHKPFRSICFRRFLALILLVAGLSAVQLVPFLDFLSHSNRSTHYATGNYTMLFSGLANYLVPLFHTFQSVSGVHFQPGQFCISSSYAGIGVLALALWAVIRIRQQRIWLLGGMLLLSLWMSLGDQGYLYAWLRQAAPAVNFMRYPVKFSVVAAFLLPLLAAFGVKEWTQTRSDDRWLPPLAGPVIIGLLAAGSMILAIAFYQPLNEMDWALTWRSALTRLLFLGLILATLTGLTRLRHDGRHKGLALALLLLIWLDAITHTPWQNPVASPTAFAPGLPTFEAMRPKPALGETRAILTLQVRNEFSTRNLTNQEQNFLIRRQCLDADCNLIDRLPQVDGFYSLYLKEERDLHFRLYDSDTTVRTNLADFLGVSQVTSKDNMFEWSARRTAMPLITAGQQPVFLSSADTLNALITERFNPREVVFLPLESRSRMAVTNRSQCHILSKEFTAHRITAQVEAEQPAWVVISQVHYHPWKAAVDGRAVPIWRVNYAFQGVEVPAGKHEITLRYQDRGFAIGAWVSALTLVGMMTWCWRLRRGSGKGQANFT